MPTYFVRQPNGLYARWSTVVDHFCELDMTEADVLDWCKPHMGTGDAVAKLQRAKDDAELDGAITPNAPPLRRWRECLDTILLLHGADGLAEFRAKYPDAFKESATA